MDRLLSLRVFVAVADAAYDSATGDISVTQLQRDPKEIFEGGKFKGEQVFLFFFIAIQFLGIFWLLSLYSRSLQGKLTSEQSEAVEVAGLYWHFVDIVWIFIFTAIYLVPYH